MAKKENQRKDGALHTKGISFIICNLFKMALRVSCRVRSDVDVKEIDKTVPNKWVWSWCDKEVLQGTPDEHLIGDCFRKLHQPGEAFCECCSHSVSAPRYVQ